MWSRVADPLKNLSGLRSMKRMKRRHPCLHLAMKERLVDVKFSIYAMLMPLEVLIGFEMEAQGPTQLGLIDQM